MKNIIFILVCSIFIIGCMISSRNKQVELKCTVEIDSIKYDIQNRYNADSVKIYSRRIKEEVYLSEINCPIVLVYNGTANALDFKTLPTSHYQRFDNFEKIESNLEKEGTVIAHNIINKCDMTKFNDLIIEFIKLDDEGKPMYRFICHYKELLK